MKSHFSFTWIFCFYITLYAGSCPRSTKNDKHHRTSNRTDIQPDLLLKDRVRQTESRQACTTDKPSLNPQEATPTQGMIDQYAGSCTHSTKNNKDYRTSNAEIPHESSAYKVFKDPIQPTSKTDIQSKNVALTQDMLNQVEQAFNAPPGALLTNVQGLNIRQEDLIRLRESGWLNDTIIEAYINMINNRSEEKENHLLPKVYAFNTYFFLTLSQEGYQGVKKWTKNRDIFSYDIVLVPIHLENHWCLAVIDFRKKAIEYYDSLGGAHKDCLSTLLSFLMAEITDKQQGELNRDEWRLEWLKDIPKQQNTNDCGVFVCKFADYVARDALINFTQNDIPYFRKRIAIEILNNKLM